MNTPSPAAVKKLIDQKKAFESYTTPESTTSASSPKAKGSPGASSSSRKTSGSRTTNGKRPSQKQPSKGIVSASSAITTDMSFTPVTTESQPPKQAPVSTPKSKKPFVRREHLTSHPFAQNEDLIALKTSLTRSSKPKSGGNSQGPRTAHRRTSTGKQSQANNSKKENN